MKQILKIQSICPIKEYVEKGFRFTGSYYEIPCERIDGKKRWGGFTHATITKIAKAYGLDYKIVKRTEPEKAKDIAIFIGSGFYPTIEYFLKEAKKMGACRRINKLPDDIVPGKSKIWLIHDKGHNDSSSNIDDRDMRKDSKGLIFGFYLLRRIEVIFDDPAQKKAFYEKIKRDDVRLSELWKNQIMNEGRRGCGVRHSGGFYLVNDITDDGLQIAKEFNAHFTLVGNFVKLNEAISYDGRRFRGYKYADDIPELLAYRILEILKI